MQVSHTDRTIIDAIDSLRELEEKLSSRLSMREAGDVVSKVDALIAALEDLISRRSQSNPETRSLSAMQRQLEQEAQHRAVAQRSRDC